MNEIRELITAKSWMEVAEKLMIYFSSITGDQTLLDTAVRDAANLLREMSQMEEPVITEEDMLHEFCNSFAVCYEFFLKHTEPSSRNDYKIELSLTFHMLLKLLTKNAREILALSGLFRQDLMGRPSNSSVDSSPNYAVICTEAFIRQSMINVECTNLLPSLNVRMEALNYYDLDPQCTLASLVSIAGRICNTVAFSLFIDIPDVEMEDLVNLTTLVVSRLCTRLEQHVHLPQDLDLDLVKVVMEMFSNLSQGLVQLKRPKHIAVRAVGVCQNIVRLLQLDENLRLDCQLCLELMQVASLCCKDGNANEVEPIHSPNKECSMITDLLNQCIGSLKLHHHQSQLRESVNRAFLGVVRALSLLHANEESFADVQSIVCTRRGMNVFTLVLTINSEYLMGQLNHLEEIRDTIPEMRERDNEINVIFNRLEYIFCTFSNFCTRHQCSMEVRESEFLSITWRIIEMSANGFDFEKVELLLFKFTEQLLEMVKERNVKMVAKIMKYLEDVVALIKVKKGNLAAIDWIDQFNFPENVNLTRVLELRSKYIEPA